MNGTIPTQRRSRVLALLPGVPLPANTGVPPRQYEEVARRANHQCEYCLAPEEFFNSRFEVEHLVPRARGGRSDEKERRR